MGTSHKRVRCTQLILVLLSLCGAVAHGQPFTKIGQLLPGAVPYAQAFGDYDGDGLMDLVCADLVATSTWETRLFHNNGNGSFSQITLPPSQHSYGSVHVFWGDDNGDGRLDLLITDSDEAGQPVMHIFDAQPDGTFVDTGIRLPGEPILWADLDNDGKLDIVAGNIYAYNDVHVYWKRQETNYVASQISFPGYLASAAGADVDGDGDLDLLLSGNGGVSLWRNDGGGRLVDTGIRFPGGGDISAAWVDVDGDGRLDIVLGGEGPTSSIVPKVYRNEGNWRFTDLTPDVIPVSGGALRWADFDQDGYPDFLVNGWWSSQDQDPRPRLFFNNHHGAFTESPLRFPAFQGGVAEVADFEGDGDVDFLIGGSEFNSNPYVRQLYRNERAQTGTNPPAPTNLIAQLAGSMAMMTWNDSAGSPGRTTYNIRVGSQPGLADVISSLSRPDGHRLLPGMGNAQTSTRWRLSGLAPGTYYWSAQAIDWSLRPSPFAPEASFVISNTPPPLPPTISDLPNLFTDEEVPTQPVSFTIGPESSLPFLQVTVEAQNPALVPADGIVLKGEGTNRSLTITPGTNQSGVCLITVRVTDAAGQSATSSFLLSVNAVNHPPVLQPIANQVTYANAGTMTVPFQVYDAETPVFGLHFQVASSNPALIPTNSIRVNANRVGPDASFIQLTPATNRVGFSVITLAVSDSMATTSVAFAVSVLPQPFTATADQFPSFEQGQAVWGDFDGDGHLDLLMVGYPSFFTSSVRYYRNIGSGGMVDSGISIAGPVLSIAAVGDLDGDGALDVLLTGSDTTRWLRNDHGTNFIVMTNLPVSGLYSSVAIGDLDNDGDLDLIFDSGTSGMRVLLNSNGVFHAASATGLPPVGTSSKALGDYDGDSILDLAFSGIRANSSFTNGVLRGLGGGTFGPSNLALDQSATGPVGWADLDGDGRLDLWQLQFSQPRQLLIYPNVGNGQFGPPIVIPVDFTDPTRIRWGDFDGDGLVDFLLEVISSDTNSGIGISTSGRYLTIYRNGGNFHFTPQGDLFGDIQAWFLALGDVNGDGTLDLCAAASQAGPSLLVAPTILLNGLSDPNLPPDAPTSLQAAVSGNSAWLSWDAAGDFNQTVPLTYNVRVGTQPGLGDVVPAMSLLTGSRQVVAPGNTGLRTNLFLTNLVGETFYWSVQAVDNSFMGGPFASEQSFQVNLPGNQPPVIGAIADQIMDEDTTLTLSFTVTDDRTPAQNLRLHIFPANPYLFPVTNLIVGGTGTNRTLTLTTGPNQNGQTTITIEATDAAGLSSTQAFGVTVRGVNDPPVISPIPDQPYAYSLEPLVVPFTVFDVDNAPEQLRLYATSSDPSVVAVSNIVFSGSGTNRLATIRPNNPQPGQTAISITVTDPEGASDTAQFLVTFRDQVFRLSTNSFGAVRRGSIAWGDLNNDGYLDLAISGQGLNQTAIYRNDGQGGFTKLDIDLPVVDGGGVAWEDFDHDGNLDLLIHGRGLVDGGLVFRIYRNAGNGQLQLFQTLGGLYGPAAWGDYDNDGWPDIISTGQDANGQPVSVLYHNENGKSFRQVATFSNIVANAALTLPGLNGPWVDINQDGNLDLLLQQYDPFVFSGWKDYLLLGDGAGHFTNVPVPWAGTMMAWADFDNDGLADILESANTREDLRVLRNNGDGTFTPWGNSLQSNWTPDSVAIGDFNADGFLDVLSFGYEGAFNYETRLFASSGTGSWQDISSPLHDYTFGTGAWADVDNDGSLDVLVNGQRDTPPDAGYTTFVYRNVQARTNSPPAAPGGLRALYSSNAVFFSWQPAADNQQSNGLTYNLRVGSIPGGLDVLPPLSSTNGSRMVPKPGNAGWSTRKVLSGLQRGRTYYWSVQAVDNGYAGSSFAAEASLTLGQPPVLAPIAPQTMTVNSRLEIPVSFSDPLDGGTGAVLTATSDTTTLLGPGGLSFSGSGTNRALLIQPIPLQYGTGLVTVTLIDAQGGLARQSFTLTVMNVPHPVISVRLLSDGIPFLTVITETNVPCAIETSTNLSVWQPVGTYSSNVGLIEFIGQPPVNGLPRFYRARLE